MVKSKKLEKVYSALQLTYVDEIIQLLNRYPGLHQQGILYALKKEYKLDADQSHISKLLNVMESYDIIICKKVAQAVEYKLNKTKLKAYLKGAAEIAEIYNESELDKVNERLAGIDNQLQRLEVRKMKYEVQRNELETILSDAKLVKLSEVVSNG